MLKKLVALASLTAVTGILTSVAVSGCSTETSVITTEGGTTDVRTERPPTPEVDSGPAVCPIETEVDTSGYKWKSPTVNPGACTEQHLAALVTYTDENETATFAQLRTYLNSQDAECGACAFAADGTTWAPMVVTSSGQLAVLNVGGCISIASGNDNCGKAYQHWFECRFEACADCPEGDTSAFQSCASAASQGACRPAIEDVLDVCGEGIEDYETTCDNEKYVFEAPIRAQCIGFGDGGTDGDAPSDG